MPDRTYRDVDIDLDDLADAVVDWFEHDGFEVQDFQEGPAIFIQARKKNLLATISATTQALNVRLQPLASGFRVQVGAGEWFDKGVGAVATAVALRLAMLPIALGAAAATGYGVYQQLKLPEQLLDFVEMYVNRHGMPRDERAFEPRRRRDRPADDEVERELSTLRAQRGAAPRPTGFCASCGHGLQPDDNFCPACGAKAARTATSDDESS